MVMERVINKIARLICPSNTLRRSSGSR
jgi:hypothetical protein